MPVHQDRLIPLLSLFLFSYICGRIFLDTVSSSAVFEPDSKTGNTMPIFEEQKVRNDVYKYTSQLSTRDFWEKISEEDAVLEEFLDILRKKHFSAFFFETPSVDVSRLHQKFEFVIVNAPSLTGVEEERDTFQTYFHSDRLAVSFPNLGGDAVLVAPVPLVEDAVYAHLADFVNGAPDLQVKEFWTLAGKTALKTINEQNMRPVWISTSGLGVYYLHLRLDSRPKYYTYQPFKHS